MILSVKLGKCINELKLTIAELVSIKIQIFLSLSFDKQS